MLFIVKDRNEVEKNGIALAEPYVMISISCLGDPANIKPNPNCKAILRIEFDDIDVPISQLGGMKCTLFEKHHAKRILEFHNDHRIKYKYMIIHCDAGISRSPGVAAALTKAEGRFDNDFFRKYIPNRRVFSMILAEHYDNEQIVVKH